MGHATRAAHEQMTCQVSQIGRRSLQQGRFYGSAREMGGLSSLAARSISQHVSHRARPTLMQSFVCINRLGHIVVGVFHPAGGIVRADAALARIYLRQGRVEF